VVAGVQKGLSRGNIFESDESVAFSFFDVDFDSGAVVCSVGLEGVLSGVVGETADKNLARNEFRECLEMVGSV
jgi:hypothetical protein